jgi:general stress protein YciG
VSQDSRVPPDEQTTDPKGPTPDGGDSPDRPPETPPDEPKPAPIQDPPAEPGRPPLVVLRGGRAGSPSESAAMSDAAKSRVVNAERKERRGFASMSPEKQREIASKGGRAAHQKGTAHEWTSEEARSAGRKGGQISRGGRGRLVEGPAGSAAGEMAPGRERPEEFTGH